MTEAAPSDIEVKVRASLAKRYRAERRFQVYGQVAIGLATMVLALLLAFVFIIGKSTFRQTVVLLPIDFTEEAALEQPLTPEALNQINYVGLIRAGLTELFPDVTSRKEKRELRKIISTGAEFELRDYVADNPEVLGTKLTLPILVNSDLDMWMKSSSGKTNSRLSNRQAGWAEQMKADGVLKTRFNWLFFTHGDSREPELAGIWGAIVGSFYTLLVCLGLSFPLGVMAAIYLEELAPKNRITRAIEVNINNLAAVPSIIFGILGLAVFLNFMGLPRSAPLVGGMVLALMTLPTIVIAGRASLQAVPPSIREAALGLGASDIQTIFHHVLPLAMPGMLTGSIIGMARALGETAPLLMIGMVAFIADTPSSVTDPAAALPVQVYLWADSPERGFIERTGAAIMVLLAFLLLMNAAAIYLRNKFETKW